MVRLRRGWVVAVLVLAALAITGLAYYSLTRGGEPPTPPEAEITLSYHLHPYQLHNTQTAVALRHNGGDTLLGDEIGIHFESKLGGRSHPNSEFVKGTVDDLGSSPSIEWDNAPTVASVSYVGDVRETWTFGERWSLILEVSDSVHYADIMWVSIVHIPSGAEIFATEYVPFPS